MFIYMQNWDGIKNNDWTVKKIVNGKLKKLVKGSNLRRDAQHRRSSFESDCPEASRRGQQKEAEFVVPLDPRTD